MFFFLGQEVARNPNKGGWVIAGHPADRIDAFFLPDSKENGLCFQLASTTMALSGFFCRKNTSIASDFRVGFHVAQISEPSARIVGRSKSSDRLVSICASSIQQTLTASSDLMLSAFLSARPQKVIEPSPGVRILSC